MKKAAIYCRVSTEMQEDDKSLQNQIERCKTYCKFKEFEITEVYTDVMSGAKDDRVSFQQLKSDMQENKFEVLVVTELSRLSRSLKTLLDFLDEINQHNVEFVSIMQNIDTSTIMGRLFFKLIGILAEFEREQTSERVRHTLHNKAKAGQWYGGVAPLGYKIVDNNLVIDEENAWKVRKLFEMYIKGEKGSSISRELNIPRNTFGRMLKNRTYTGKNVYGKRKVNILNGKLENIDEKDWTVVDGNHEAIIDEETFEKAQMIFRKRHKNNIKQSENPNYLLGGLIKCYCGFSLTGSKSQRNRYYVCPQRRYRKENPCQKKNVNAEKFDKVILNEILELKKHPKKIKINENDIKKDENSKEQEELKGLIVNLEENKKKKSRLTDLLLNETIDEDLYREKVENINIEINNLKTSISILQEKLEYDDSSDSIDNTEYFFELLNEIDLNMDRMELKKILFLLIDRIEFINDFEYKIYYNI